MLQCVRNISCNFLGIGQVIWVAEDSDVRVEVLQRMLSVSRRQSQCLSDFLVNNDVDSHATLSSGLE